MQRNPGTVGNVKRGEKIIGVSCDKSNCLLSAPVGSHTDVGTQEMRQQFLDTLSRLSEVVRVSQNVRRQTEVRK